MEFAKLKKIEDKVTLILEEEPSTRDDDQQLYVEYIRKTNPEVAFLFDKAFAQARLHRIPPMESIGRTRRKVQSKNCCLKATKPVQDKRKDSEAEYFEYAKRG